MGKIGEKVTWEQDNHLLDLIKEGWESRNIEEWDERYDSRNFDNIEEKIEGYKKRIRKEFKVISKMGYSKYFIIVWDLLNWAREEELLLGPGRGSACGSLISYLLNITEIDPIPHGLIFERFISPTRIDLPDIDIDFEKERRDEVKEYLINKYGREVCANIGTFIKFKGKAAIRDTSRVFDIPGEEVDKVAEHIISRSGGDARKSFTIEDTVKEVKEGREFAKKYPQVIRNAGKIEGQCRTSGVHASGFIIADRPLTDFTALTERHDEITCEYEYHDLEDQGLVKFDILGLKTLSILRKAKELVKERHGVDIDYYDIPMDDEEVYENFAEGNTAGVFQFESDGLTKYSQDLSIDNARELYAANALFRPGTLRSGLANSYVRRKHGREEIPSINEDYDKITEETYGCLLYQEQMMFTLHDLGNFSFGKADELRKITGKSLGKAAFNEFRPDFVDGCEENGLSREVANELFDQMVEFGAFAFNKSHAVAYGTIAYLSMWMKLHYPKEFLKVALSSNSDDDKIKKYIKEARRLDIEILPPSVNHSKEKYTIEDEGIRVGLLDVKNVGSKAIQEILKAQPFENFYDFVDRVDRRRVHKGVIKSLALANTFQEFCSNQKFMVENIEDILKAKTKSKQKEWLDKMEKAEDKEDYGEEERMEIKANVLAIPPEKHPMEFYRDVFSDIDEDHNFVGVKKWQEVDNNVFLSSGIISKVSFTGGSGQVKKVYVHLEDEDTFEILLFNDEVREKWGSRIENAEFEPIIVEVLRNEKGLCVADDVAWIKDFRGHLEEGEGFTEFEKDLLEKPQSKYEKVFKKFGLKTAKDLYEMSDEEIAGYKMTKKEIKCGGIISKNYEHEAKNGLMSFASFKSGGYNIDLLVWADAYKKFKDYLKIGTPVALKVLPADNKNQFMIDVKYNDCKVVPLEKLQKKLE